MQTMAEMVEAHLTNVQREIAALTERKTAIEQEVQKLQKYFEDGIYVLNQTKAAATKLTATEPQAQKSLF